MGPLDSSVIAAINDPRLKQVKLTRANLDAFFKNVGADTKKRQKELERGFDPMRSAHSRN
ncbi:hypothetical protein OZX73_01805 [Bifidobacterium sp. ESL0775]|uniref:hypothetical protein n=1 Tax=Bifidobacterium sp. ESL0775 TaxID=2983230 RepID=UPI0023F9BCC7|nr:hypothetical protein [Bifidobacterium sp. ESL0775]WEV69647.1 hypothetical protein OZX73_01805 [Bifidobacterium sp. ESL0775]